MKLRFKGSTQNGNYIYIYIYLSLGGVSSLEPPESGKCSARGVRVCERASVCVWESVGPLWCCTSKIVTFVFFSASVAVVVVAVLTST